MFRLLNEIEKIERKDLLDFLHKRNTHLKRERREQVLGCIMKRTNGHYEKTIEELKNLQEQAWEFSEESEEDYDY